MPLAHLKVSVPAVLTCKRFGCQKRLFVQGRGNDVIDSPRLKAKLFPQKAGGGRQHAPVVVYEQRKHSPLLSVLRDDADFPEGPEPDDASGQRRQAQGRDWHSEDMAREA